MAKFIAHVALLVASYVVWINLFTKGFDVDVVSWWWVFGMLTAHFCILVVHLVMRHEEEETMTDPKPPTPEEAHRKLHGFVGEDGTQHDCPFMCAPDAEPCKLLKALRAQREAGRRESRDALMSMVQQFAYWGQQGGVGGYVNGGLSALEEAFDILGYDEFIPAPDAECCASGCHSKANCGTPTSDGYEWTCGKHVPPMGVPNDQA